MKSETTIRFRKAYANLSPHLKEATRKAYKLWQSDSLHPSLSFKRIHHTLPIYSVRISLAYRALCTKQNSTTYIWFWIGSHTEYDKLIKQL